MNRDQRTFQAGVGICLLFGLCVVVRIWQESFVVSGIRYFNVLDDSLISMRYGWNLAHGFGPVWNPGEPVEGYTNPLMVLLTAAFAGVASKPGAVLLLQLSGLAWVLASAWLAAGVYRDLVAARPVEAPNCAWGQTFVLAATLLYYPLASLSVHGLETGLLTTLILLALRMTFRSGSSRSPSRAAAVSGVLFLAYLSRPDAALPGALILLYGCGLALRRPEASLTEKGRVVIAYLAPFALAIVAHLLWRQSYYDAWLPNTYSLKVGGIESIERIRDGYAYVLPFLKGMAGLIGLAMAGVALGRTERHLLLAALFTSLVGYHVYTGGDFLWILYRFIVPGVPLLLALAADGAIRIGARLGKGAGKRVAPWIPAGALLVALVLASQPYLRSWMRGDEVLRNQNQVAIARSLTVEWLTNADAVVGVFGAGHVPYYSGRPAVDFLGKMDPAITRLEPHRDSPVARAHGGRIWPGHAKYDLEYSIVELRPDVVQGLRWLDQDLREWGRSHYKRFKLGPMVLFLLNDSPRIHWEKLVCEEDRCRPAPDVMQGWLGDAGLLESPGSGVTPTVSSIRSASPATRRTPAPAARHAGPRERGERHPDPSAPDRARPPV